MTNENNCKVKIAPETKDLMLIVHQEDNDPKSFYVSVPSQGCPDFHVRANSIEDAAALISSYIYNELDGRDTVVDEGVEDA